MSCCEVGKYVILLPRGHENYFSIINDRCQCLCIVMHHPIFEYFTTEADPERDLGSCPPLIINIVVCPEFWIAANELKEGFTHGQDHYGIGFRLDQGHSGQ